MSKISAVLIARNEEKKIRNCLESIKWCDEIIFIDQDNQIDELMEKNAQVEQELNEVIVQIPEWYKKRYLDFIEEIKTSKIANSLLEQQVKKQKADIDALLKINRELQNNIEEDKKAICN